MIATDWPLADIRKPPINVRFRGVKADMERSAIGTKRTSACALHMSAFGGKADIPSCTANVRL
jgi:hypothetical protein